MFKKIAVIVLSLLLFASFTTAAKKKHVKKDEVKPVQTEVVVQKEAVVQKETTFKDKLALGYDLIDRNVYFRFWPNYNMGMEFTGGLGFTTGNQSSFTFNAGMNIIFPMYNAGSFYLNLDPGIRLGYNNGRTTIAGINATQSSFNVILGCWLEGEVFLTAISKDFSIGSSFGAGLIINPNSTSVNGNTSSSTSIGLSVALPDFSVVPLVVRYYF